MEDNEKSRKFREVKKQKQTKEKKSRRENSRNIVTAAGEAVLHCQAEALLGVVKCIRAVC